jgi:hypothetical protein
MMFPPRNEFREWLENMDPDFPIAEGWSCYTCPLATWMRDTGFAEHAYIRPDDNTASSAWRAGERPTAPLPAWANAFGRQVDKLGIERAEKASDSYGSVTADDCLSILESIP